jgi:Arc-like DNA binding dprotein
MARKPTDTVQLKLRFSEALRRRLEREAKDREHSLNSEIVNRLAQSFRKEDDADLAIDVFRGAFGAPTSELLRALATAIWLIEGRTRKKWYEDEGVGSQAILAIEEITRSFIRGLHAARAFRSRIPAVAMHQITMAANAAALETLQKMGMAFSEAQIEAARMFRAEKRASKRAKDLDKKFVKAAKAKDKTGGLGEPVRKLEVFPLNNPPAPTPDSLPAKEPKPVPLREKEPQFGISGVWTATPSLKIEDDGEKK